MTAKKGEQQNFQNRMGEFACVLNLHAHAWMSYVSVRAKNSLSAGDAPPLWCLACGFLVKAVKQRSITSTDAQMCFRLEIQTVFMLQGYTSQLGRRIYQIKAITILTLNNCGSSG